MKYVSLVLILFFATLAVQAQEPPKVEVFGGYSYLRADLGGGSADSHGVTGSVTYNFDRILGIKADFGTQTGSLNVPVQLNNGIPGSTTSFDIRPSYFSFLFGPQIAYRKSERFTPFAHVLLGGVRRKARVPLNLSLNPPLGTNGVSFVTGSDTAFGTAIGGGLDIRLSKRAAIRLFQADYFLTRFSPDTQHNLRISTGLVLRFGK